MFLHGTGAGPQHVADRAVTYDHGEDGHNSKQSEIGPAAFKEEEAEQGHRELIRLVGRRTVTLDQGRIVEVA
jgi:hypothetical protein